MGEKWRLNEGSPDVDVGSSARRCHVLREAGRVAKETHFMKRNKLKAVLASRQAVLLGASVAVVGLSLLSAVPANAALGTQPGTLTITPATGPLTKVPTWGTTIACPSTANGSAKLLLVN